VLVSLKNFERVGEKTKELLVLGRFDDVNKIVRSSFDEIGG
jgi:hypothetical protein